MATEKELDKARVRIEIGSLAGPEKIGARVLNKYKVAWRFALAIEDHNFWLYRITK